jgi:hypothetical protein
MAPLVEAISVIARHDRLDTPLPGERNQYIADYPDATACADACLVRVGLMDPASTRAHLQRLEGLGFIHRGADGAAPDLVVIEQLYGRIPLAIGLNMATARSVATQSQPPECLVTTSSISRPDTVSPHTSPFQLLVTFPSPYANALLRMHP